MPQTVFELGQKVKAKYPGAYDDLSDDELGRKVKTKYPGSYDDFMDIPKAGAPTPIPRGLQPEPSGDSFLKDSLMGVDYPTMLERAGGFAGSVINTLLPSGDTPRPDTSPPMAPEEQVGAKIAAVSPLVEGAGNLIGRVKGLRAGPVAAPQDIAEVEGIRKLAPTTAEAQATAGRIAAEAQQRGLPVYRKQPAIDFQVYQDLSNAEAELKAAKLSTLPKKIQGQPVLEQFDSLIQKHQIEPPPHISYGMETRTATGAEYQPVIGIDQETMAGARAKNLGTVRDKVNKLIDDSGSIDSHKLQQLKEDVDREIFEHSGWRDTGTAADKANLYALREANGELRTVLDSLGNERLNKANAAYSHYADRAKIVDLRRPDLQGLPSNQAKAARSLTPLKEQPSYAKQVVKKALPYAAAGALGAAGAKAYQVLKPNQFPE